MYFTEYAVGIGHGRRVIKTDVDEITADNVLSVLSKALTTHYLNKTDMEYLYAEYKGKQAILNRVKEVRPEICNKIVENRYAEIVDFKVGYLVGEPLQYVARLHGNGDEKVLKEVERLNDFMVDCDKDSEDTDLAEWFHEVGTAYRMVLPVPHEVEDTEAPFEIYTLDPRYAFVIHYSGLGNKPMMGVKYVVREDGVTVYSCYTVDQYFEIADYALVKHEYHNLGGIPIVEYPMNRARVGAAEMVLPLLDAINLVDSNRIDGVEQFVQALLKFHNVDISEEDYEKFRQEGAIKYRDADANMKAEVEYITNELRQAETQVLVDHLYEVVLTICGMPNRNGGTSTSDTGSAVIMRDGWSAAEARAKSSERMFRKPEKAFLRVVLNICNTLSGMNLKLSDIGIRFTRRNYENILQKSQVLTTMLANPKIAPRLAFVHCGMFAAPDEAYRESVKYAEEQEAKAQALAEKEAQNNVVSADTGAAGHDQPDSGTRQSGRGEDRTQSDRSSGNPQEVKK